MDKYESSLQVLERLFLHNRKKEKRYCYKKRKEYFPGGSGVLY